MRVLVITNMYPPHHYGGYELNCREFTDAMRAAGHEMLVLTSDHRVVGVNDPDEDRGLVRRDLRLYWQDQRIIRPSLLSCLARERANQRALEEALRAIEPDVVSTWAMGAVSLGLLTACRRRDLPIVAVVNDDWLVYGPKVDRWQDVSRRIGPAASPVERVLRLPCRLPTLGFESAVLLISETIATRARKAGWWQAARSSVGYCGVNLDDFPIVARGDRPWRWRLLHVGRIDDRKGIDTCLQALALLPSDATLTVVGRGDDGHRAVLERLAVELGVEGRVSFDVCTRHDLAERYAAADALLFTPRWAEPFGLVPLEAMACSTPVVTTGTGGSGEFLIDGANCLRVPVDDPAAVARSVERLAAEPGLRAQLVSGGRSTAEELSLRNWLELLERWHLATASGFSDGQPARREPIEAVLSRVL